MIHKKESNLAGKTVKIKRGIVHPQVGNFGGSDFIVEDWWDRVNGTSWQHAVGNPAALIYALRTGMSPKHTPLDDEVLYGKTPDGLGHLVHITELEL